MKVTFVGAGPGDPELLTLRAHGLLRSCRCVIYAGSLVSPQVMDLVPDEAEKHDSAAMTLEDIATVCAGAQRRGIDVVRLHSGDPSLYGAIREQMNELDRLGIEYEVVPGVSSFQAAAAALRVELTAPEVAQTVILTRAAGRTPLPETQALERLAASRATLCIFLSVHRLEEMAQTLVTHYGAECPAAVVFHASWPDQRIVRGTLADIDARTQEAGIGRTAMVLVGHALSREIPVSKLYDAAFSHGYREQVAGESPGHPVAQAAP